MAKAGSTLLPFLLPSLPFPFIILAAVSGIFSQIAYAQRPASPPVEGYITAVNPPTGFDINRMHVKTTSETRYALLGAKSGVYDDSLRNALRIGTYVQVTVLEDNASKTVMAHEVLFRGDWDKKLEGAGVIDKVVSTGAEPVFQADGYRIRITSATDTAFKGDLKSLADVTTSMWLRYEGKRDKSGVLVASKARFLPAEKTGFKSVPFIESWDLGIDPAGSSKRDPRTAPPRRPTFSTQTAL